MKFNDSDEKNQNSEGTKRWFIKGVVGKNGISCCSHRKMSLEYNMYEHICMNISKNQIHRMKNKAVRAIMPQPTKGLKFIYLKLNT